MYFYFFLRCCPRKYNVTFWVHYMDVFLCIIFFFFLFYVISMYCFWNIFLLRSKYYALKCVSTDEFRYFYLHFPNYFRETLCDNPFNTCLFNLQFCLVFSSTFWGRFFLFPLCCRFVPWNSYWFTARFFMKRQ